MRIACIITAVLLVSSCTDNQRARAWGGTVDVRVTPGQKVIGATWKNSDLWIIHRPMRDGEVPEVVTMTESSNFVIMEGHVVIRERAAKAKVSQ